MSFHIRRKDREITDHAELRQVLKKTKYVTIAFCKDNEPYLVALSHGYDQERNCLYFHCAPEGKKLVYAKVNNRVWGEAILDYEVTDDCDYTFTSVHFSGILFLISEFEEKKRALETLIRQTSSKPEAKLSKVKPEKIATTTIGRIDITYMSGKKHRIQPKI